MSKKIRYLIVFLLIAFVLAMVAWRYTFRKAETSVAEKAAFSLEVPALLAAFESNEDSANALYLDKILEVHGTVETVTPDSLGYSVYLKDTAAVSGVLCSFDKEALDPALVITGATVTLKGLCTGYLLDVNLNRCAIVKVAQD